MRLLNFSVSNGQPAVDRIYMDYIFEPSQKNDDVFEFIKPIFKSAIEGINVCCIAYGASGELVVLFQSF